MLNGEDRTCIQKTSWLKASVLKYPRCAPWVFGKLAKSALISRETSGSD